MLKIHFAVWRILISPLYPFCVMKHRHVILPREMVSQIPTTRLMDDKEWRKLGIQQSRGWMHYMIHAPGISLRNPYLLHLSLFGPSITCNSTWFSIGKSITDIFLVSQCFPQWFAACLIYFDIGYWLLFLFRTTYFAVSTTDQHRSTDRKSSSRLEYPW